MTIHAPTMDLASTLPIAINVVVLLGLVEKIVKVSRLKDVLLLKRIKTSHISRFL